MSPQSARNSKNTASVSTGTWIVEQARARGLDPGYAIGRLAHSSFVSRRHRYLYIETPKAACTQLKHFIAGVEGVPCDIDRTPYLRETRLPMLIHQRRYLQVPTLLDLDAAEARDLLSGQAGYFKFALVRNPYSRLVSAFENKVRLREPGFGNVAHRWSAAETGADVRATFADFVREAIPLFGQQFREHHFVPQRDLLLPDLIAYSRVFQVERFGEFEDAFSAHLRAQGASGPLAFQERNRSLYPNWRLYYDEPTARRVAAFYVRDFESFGYDLESWRLDHTPPPLVTSQSDAYWRKAIIERNEMIEFLYDRMNIR